MKIPLPATGNIDPSRQAIAYSNQTASPAAFGAGVGAAIAGAGQNLEQVSQALRQRDDQLTQTKTATDWANFQGKFNEDFTNLKRGAPADGKGFADLAEGQYSKSAEAFLAGVPEQYREQYRTRIADMKNQVVGNSLDFQYKAGDQFFKQSASDLYQSALKAVDPSLGGSPDVLETQMGQLEGEIDKMGLTPADKEQLKHNFRSGLQSIAYKGATVSALQSQFGGDVDTYINKTIQAESGGNNNEKSKTSSASGLGQFIDSTWVGLIKKYRPDLADGQSNSFIVHLKADAGLQKEMLKNFTQENARDLTNGGVPVNETSLYLAHFLGSSGAVRLLRSDPNTPIANAVDSKSIAANPEVFGKYTTVGALTGWAAKKMGNQSPGDLVNDPRFKNMPYELAATLTADAQKQFTQMSADQMDAQNSARNSQIESLKAGVLQGTAGLTDINAAWSSGIITSATDLAQLNATYTKQQKELTQQQAFSTFMSAPNAVFDPTDEQAKKSFNSWVGPQGLNAVAQGDSQYLNTSLLPAVRKAGDIPTDVAGTLQGAMRSSNQQQALTAMETMSQLEAASPRGFAARFPDSVQRDVANYNNLKGTYPADQLYQVLNPGITQEQRQSAEMLRKQGQDILTTKTDKVPKLDELVKGFQGQWDGWFTSAPTLQTGWAAQSLYRDYQNVFLEEYSKTGNEQLAAKNAQDTLNRTYGPTQTGAGNVLMKFPPEKTGYALQNGDTSWVNDQVKAEYKLKPSENFQLVADDTTREEFLAHQSNPSAPLPSYQMMIIDAEGVTRVPTDAGQRRWYGEITPDVKGKIATQLQQQTDFNQVEGELTQAQNSLAVLKNLYNQSGTTGPEIEPLQKKVDILQQRYDKLKPPVDSQNKAAFSKTGVGQLLEQGQSATPSTLSPQETDQNIQSSMDWIRNNLTNPAYPYDGSN